MSNFSEERLAQIWDKGQTIRGKNPDLYRKDIYMETPCTNPPMAKQVKWGGMLTIPNPNLLAGQTI